MFRYINTKGNHLFLKMATKETNMFDAGLLFIIFGSALTTFSNVYTEEFGVLLTDIFQFVIIAGCVGFAHFAHEIEKKVLSHEGFEDFKQAADMPFSEFDLLWNDKSND